MLYEKIHNDLASLINDDAKYILDSVMDQERFFLG